MYSVAPSKSSSATRPPCFWNCGTAAGEVLKTRHGALPAVIAAPMTSSEVLPAGISWAVTFSLGCAAFQAATIALPQASSSGLFDSQILIGPVDAPASPTPPEPPPQAAVSAEGEDGECCGSDRAFSSCSPFDARARRGLIGAGSGPVEARTTRCGGGQVDVGRGPSPSISSSRRVAAARPQAEDVGADGGQRRLEVRGELGVVEAGDGQLARDVEAAAAATAMPAMAIRSLA